VVCVVKFFFGGLVGGFLFVVWALMVFLVVVWRLFGVR
jgi:hypothetical protein